jgi:hypothetical protein
MKKIIGVFLIVSVLSGCSFKSQYVGKTVIDPSMMCILVNLDTSGSESCRTETRTLSFDLVVEKGRNADDYTVKGSATTKISTVYHKVSSGNFNLLLLRGKRVIEDIPFFLDGWLTKKDNIFVEFNTKEKFNGMAITYNIMMTDQ